MKRDQEHYRGCLIGGAIGDALGYPVEFMSFAEIQQKFGKSGIQDLILAPIGKALISDDTQMSLFTAEGLLWAETQRFERGKCDIPSALYLAYQRWLLTQNPPITSRKNRVPHGWLFGIPELHVGRATGLTCLRSLESGIQGSTGKPINDSKGCGGVMRVAPIGLISNTLNAFELGMDSAALTHGHPSGFLSAGALSYLIARIMEGCNLEEAVEVTLEKLATFDNHQECSRKLKKAWELSRQNIDPIQAIEKLGEGWVGEEALAISVYCALKHSSDFRKALVTAVNHNGDSDSTGAITGNILGAYLGIRSIPDEWINGVELSGLILQMADDLLTGYEDSDAWREKYPGE